MAWIESHQELRDHPKTKRLARRLGISVPAAIGHLHCLWWWAMDYAPDGDISDYDAEDIADAAMWDGDAEQFLQALIDCGPGASHGFIERTESGHLLLHDWWDYAGGFIQARSERSKAGIRGNHERWHVRRGIIDPDCPLCQEESQSDVRESACEPQKTRTAIANGSQTDRKAIANHRTKPDHTIPNRTVPRDEEDANASSPDGRQDDHPTAKGQIGELVAAYREACNADPQQRDYAFMGRLYNTYPIDRIYDAIETTALRIAAGHSLKDPLTYIAGVLRRGEVDKPRASPGVRETPIDRKLRELGVV